ncbi:tetratricopeptide repeat protein [Silvibacterium sp.]|uniref:tetratricopeptide repeat protein n=1 Tax=Silvibacterium sp. TaxID=1964179 RepID=UPI0039E72681
MPLTPQPEHVSPGIDAQSLYDLALDALADGDVSTAVARFRASIAADPAFADARHGLIHALRDAGEFETAITEARALIADYPDDPLGYTSLSILLQQQNRIEEAEAAALQAKLAGWKQQLRQPSGAPSFVPERNEP